MLGCCGQRSPNASRQEISLSLGLRELIQDCRTSALAWNPSVGEDLQSHVWEGRNPVKHFDFSESSHSAEFMAKGEAALRVLSSRTQHAING